MATFSVEFPDHVGAALRQLATMYGTTAEAMLTSAAGDLVAEAVDLDGKLARAEADVAAGRVVSHEEVRESLRRILDEADARRAAE